MPPDLLGGGGAEPVLHLAVPVLITAGPTVLVAVTEVPALQVDMDPAQLAVVSVVVETSLAPEWSTLIGPDLSRYCALIGYYASLIPIYHKVTAEGTQSPY